MLLKGHDAPKDRLTRAMDFSLGWLFRGFNRMFGKGADAYGTALGGAIKRKSVMMGLYLALVGVAYGLRNNFV